MKSQSGDDMPQGNADKKSRFNRGARWTLRTVVAAVITQFVALYIQIPYLSTAASWVWSSVQEFRSWLDQDAALSHGLILVAALVGCALATVVVWLWRKLVATKTEIAERDRPNVLNLDPEQLAVLRIIGMHVELKARLRFDSVVRKTGLSRIAAQVALDALRAAGLIPDGKWTEELSILTVAGRNYIHQTGLLAPSQP